MGLVLPRLPLHGGSEVRGEMHLFIGQLNKIYVEREHELS